MFIAEVIFKGIAFIFAVYVANKAIEEYQEKYGKSKKIPLSYQVRIYVELEWFKIIRWCFPKFKTDDEAIEFVNSLYENSKLKLVKDGGLFGKGFKFVEFHDESSGLNPIWSDYHKDFIDDLEVHGDIFEDYKKRIWRKFSESHISRPIVISPGFIGFSSDLPDGYMGEENKISQIPYFDIINFFVNVEKNSGTIEGGSSMVKKFPKRLQEIFDKYQVEYDPLFYEDYGCGNEPNTELVKTKWLESKGIELYNQRMQRHTFKTPYYTITISLKFFESQESIKQKR